MNKSRNDEWLPKSPGANAQREREALALREDAEALLTIALQLDCPNCRRILIETSNQYNRWARELLDRRRRMVPVVPRKRLVLVKTETEKLK